MKKTFFAIATLAVLAASCEKDDQKPEAGIFKGPVKPWHSGKAFTWLETDNNNKPLKIAINISDEAWAHLPTGADQHEHDHDHENAVRLKFHPKVDSTIFNHVELGWNPHGHDPMPIYGIPHFDFHFYNVSTAAVDAIPPYELDSMKFKNLPAPEYFPANYMYFGGGVPKMGTHLIDVTSPEVNGAVFGQTFIYGSYNGKVTFTEPMITKAFIEANPSFSRAIPQPAKVQKTGFYPTRLRFARNAGSRDFILEDFVYRTAQ